MSVSAPPISSSSPRYRSATSTGWSASGSSGRPGWRTYVAYEGTVPAASGALYCRDGVAWLGVGATIPAWRRRGAQGALISRRIADAIATGCRDIVADAGQPVPGEPSPAYANMLRNGFRVAYSRPNYVLAH